MSWEASASETAASEAPPVNRMVIAVLSLVGFFIAFYLLAHTLGWTGPLICGVGECSTVQSSRYAWVGPVPVSGIGLVGYLALLGLSVLGIQPGWRSSGGVKGEEHVVTVAKDGSFRYGPELVASLPSLPELGRMRRRAP